MPPNRQLPHACTHNTHIREQETETKKNGHLKQASLFHSYSFFIFDRRKKEKTRLPVYHSIVFFMALVDLLASFSFFMSDFWTNGPGLGTVGNRRTCNYQGWSLQFALSSPLWNAVLATYYLLRVRFRYKEGETAHHLKNLAIPFADEFH
jgi:hypothetical protein